jgi:hypothetical protein
LRFAGEYAFNNGGAYLGDVPLARLYEIGYFLAYREFVRRIDTEDDRKVRTKAARALDTAMTEAEVDDETGLPAWVVASGIQPADGSPLM